MSAHEKSEQHPLSSSHSTKRTEKAEKTLIKVFEERERNATNDPAPPRIPFSLTSDEATASQHRKVSPLALSRALSTKRYGKLAPRDGASFRDIVAKVQEANGAYGTMNGEDNESIVNARTQQQQDSTTEDRSDSILSMQANYFSYRSNTERMLNAAEKVEQRQKNLSTVLEAGDDNNEQFFEDEFHSTDNDDKASRPGEAGVTMPLFNKVRRKKKENRCWQILRNQYLIAYDVINPVFLLKAAFSFLFFKVLLIMVPLLALAIVLYYNLGNPRIDFLPGNVPISWWLVFTVRQMVTMQLAIVCEHFFCDIIALRSTLSVKILGPLATLTLCNAEGWPFIVASWGLWDLILLQGDQPFVRNWLFFLEVSVFDENRNPGSHILNSGLYTRILVSMIIVGVLTTLKRTRWALYFGKEMFLHFGPRLEQITVKMLLLSDLADLAEVVDDKTETTDLSVEKLSAPKRWDMEFHKKAKVRGSFQDRDYVEEAEMNIKRDSTLSVDHSSALECFRSIKKEVVEFLEDWDEPASKSGKTDEPLIKDILQFRKALWYMEGPYPFSESFGPAKTRDKFLVSVMNLYLRLSPSLPTGTNHALDFDLMSAIAYNVDGGIDEKKMKELKVLFRPDKNDEVPLLEFIHSCDQVYKELLFFRAAVENSFQIDARLEGVLNGIFYFVLGLIVLAVLDFDPWSLLLSFSSLLVSFSFALGPSVSKYVEGVLLIAVRRPYDLGDRIVIYPPTSDKGFSPATTWFVENVTLFHTTLRFGATNEVATLSNSSIAQLRIHNGNRSNTAIVAIPLFLKTDTKQEKISLFHAAIEKYIDNSCSWQSIVHFRTESTTETLTYLKYSLRVEHVANHQRQTQILKNKGEMIRFCIKELKRLGINYVPFHKCVDVFVKEDNTRAPPRNAGNSQDGEELDKDGSGYDNAETALQSLNLEAVSGGAALLALE